MPAGNLHEDLDHAEVLADHVHVGGPATRALEPADVAVAPGGVVALSFRERELLGDLIETVDLDPCEFDRADRVAVPIGIDSSIADGEHRLALFHVAMRPAGAGLLARKRQPGEPVADLAAVTELEAVEVDVLRWQVGHSSFQSRWGVR